MRITSGYRVEILKLHKPLERTLKVCREAVDWLYPVMEKEWEALSEIRMEKQRFNAAEKLIHTTARNKAKYSFDAAFPKRPSYLRRAVLQHVLGAVSSARTRSDNGCPLRNHYMPVFYKDNTYRKEEDCVFLKLWNGMISGIRQFFNRLKNMKKYKYFKCPECKSRLRLPRGVGEVTVTCGKCHHPFKQKA